MSTQISANDIENAAVEAPNTATKVLATALKPFAKGPEEKWGVFGGLMVCGFILCQPKLPKALHDED